MIGMNDRAKADLLNKLTVLRDYVDTNYEDITDAKAAKAVPMVDELFAIIERRRK